MIVVDVGGVVFAECDDALGNVNGAAQEADEEGYCQRQGEDAVGYVIVDFEIIQYTRFGVEEQKKE